MKKESLFLRWTKDIRSPDDATSIAERLLPENQLAVLREAAKRYLEENHDPDARVSEACRDVLFWADRAEEALANGDARTAFSAGLYLANADNRRWIQANWEKPALSGYKAAAGGNKGRGASRDRKEERDTEYQRLADELWAQNRKLSRVQVARRIRDKVVDPLSVDEIRRRIKPPE